MNKNYYILAFEVLSDDSNAGYYNLVSDGEYSDTYADINGVRYSINFLAAAQIPNITYINQDFVGKLFKQPTIARAYAGLNPLALLSPRNI